MGRGTREGVDGLGAALIEILAAVDGFDAVNRASPHLLRNGVVGRLAHVIRRVVHGLRVWGWRSLDEVLIVWVFHEIVGFVGAVLAVLFGELKVARIVVVHNLKIIIIRDASVWPALKRLF